MKKLMMTTAALAVGVLGFAGASVAADNVLDTKHNLSTTAGAVRASQTFYALTGAGADEVCVFCHTPHAANTTVGVALWNRQTNATGFTMYSSSTMDMTVDAAPTGVSLACLSCHDGTIGFDALLNYPGSGTAAPTPAWTFTAPNLAGAGVTEIGKDLSNDHPISVTYNNSATGDTAFKDATTFTNVRLYGGKVQCASCHNPHEATLPTFLRVSNAGSALCKECHIK